MFQYWLILKVSVNLLQPHESNLQLYLNGEIKDSHLKESPSIKVNNFLCFKSWGSLSKKKNFLYMHCVS